MEKAKYDYSKLRGKIREMFKTESAFAEVMGMSRATLSAKLVGKNNWKQDEILEAMKVLGIPRRDVFTYFFTEEVAI